MRTHSNIITLPWGRNGGSSESARPYRDIKRNFSITIRWKGVPTSKSKNMESRELGDQNVEIDRVDGTMEEDDELDAIFEEALLEATENEWEINH